jgi:hypothetical protein
MCTGHHGSNKAPHAKRVGTNSSQIFRHDPSTSENELGKSEIEIDEKGLDNANKRSGARSGSKHGRRLRKRTLLAQIAIGFFMIGLPVLFIGKSIINPYSLLY